MADLQRRVTKSGDLRWDVRYRDDARQQRKRSFERKLDAQRFARSVETDLLRGGYPGHPEVDSPDSIGTRERRRPPSRPRAADGSTTIMRLQAAP